MALAAVAPGTSVFHEAHYGSRFDHAGGMRALGARISIDGEHGTVKGGERLRGARLAGAGIRETTALLLLSLAAEGRTWLSDIGSLYRGYEDLPGALRHLGAPLHVLD
ncbi:EPSP synthase (3-phosphoshikimate 1-carboxyvinyltransferase) family protein [Pseudomonas aeruginosa]|nr:EPSP synthase (3-phosphoshikimate 1-carboxyvinyltransferase) family protein [Pseudomonas aeruginosa]